MKPIRSPIVAAAAVALTAAACSSAGSPSSAPAGTSGSTAAATAAAAGSALPAALQHGQLVTPAVVGYPPYAYLIGSKISGIDPDLSVALGKALGRPVTLQIASFENSLLGLERGTYFMVTGSDITAAREKTFDMVSYLADHYEFASLVSHPPIGASVTDLCGLTISTVAADSSIPILSHDSSACNAAGKKPITVTTFPDQGSAVLAVESGKADATTATVTNLGYVAEQNPGKFRLGGPSYDYVYIGIATQKGNGVAQALAHALDRLIADGTYKQILDRYDVEADAVTQAEVNPSPVVTHP
jgi:polar amino acid transport system substrate-binding protein